MVATPIGNRADLTLRAVHGLALADAVACEDTRVSGALLAHLGLSRPLIALHEHNEREAAAQVVARLARGERVAYVSDAGTPAVSDPGAALQAALTKEMTVIALTGVDTGVIELMGETAVHIAVPHERAARVFESHALVLHCLADAVDLQLMGEQDSA